MLFVIQSWLFRSSLFLWSVIDNLIFGRAPCSQASWPDQHQVQGDSEWAGNGINESNNDTIYILDYKYTEEDICCLASSERPTAQKPTNINAKWRPDKNTLEVSPQLVSLLWRRWALAESDGGLQGFTNINQASLTQCSGWGKTAYTGSFIIPVAKYWLVTPTFMFLESFCAYCQLTRYSPFDNICLPSFQMDLKRPRHHAINQISKKVANFVILENVQNFKILI